METPGFREDGQKIRVAIDGPAGAGKSTVARMVSDLTGLVYVDTGAMYRGLALAALAAGVDPEKEEDLLNLIPRCGLSFRSDGGDFRVFVDGADVTDRLHSRVVDGAVKAVARHPGVRRFMVGAQREMAESKDVIMEGRDITSVVLPDAEVKVYLTAEFRERVRRRWAELARKGEDASWDDLKEEMASRDHADASREEGPLLKVADAVLLDTTGKSQREVALAIVEMCKRVRKGERSVEG